VTDDVVTIAPTTPTTPTAPARWRLLYSPRAWRQWFRATSARIEAAHLDWNLRAVAPHVAPGARVLDVGAWDCRLGAALRDRHGARVVCTDVVDKNRTDVELRIMRGTTLPVADDERFDVVTLLYVLHHAADDRAVLREARRVLAPDGVVLVGEDRVETVAERIRTVAFHVWLLMFTFMGWKGRFRRQAAWRARFAEAGLAVREHRALGATRWWFPENELYVLAEATPVRSTGQVSGAADGG
jgi:SAM-dependent methyltransferase